VPSAESLALFLGAALILNLTPGPDMTYVAARSIHEGRQAGVVAALGVAVGSLGHVAAVALGLAALLAAVPMAYDILRIAGALYLVVLGFTLVFRTPEEQQVGSRARAGLKIAFVQGIITNLLNPKVALFFLAFLPQFVDLDAGPAVPQIIVLGLLFNVQGTLVNVAVALLASRMTRGLRSRAPQLAWLRRLTGAVFVALGARLGFDGR
jgi:threonine/homoserine/homoserine lactone efflux protein